MQSQEDSPSCCVGAQGGDGAGPGTGALIRMGHGWLEKESRAWDMGQGMVG